MIPELPQNNGTDLLLFANFILHGSVVFISLGQTLDASQSEVDW
jgi:hypothetical protein